MKFTEPTEMNVPRSLINVAINKFMFVQYLFIYIVSEDEKRSITLTNKMRRQWKRVPFQLLRLSLSFIVFCVSPLFNKTNKILLNCSAIKIKIHYVWTVSVWSIYMANSPNLKSNDKWRAQAIKHYKAIHTHLPNSGRRIAEHLATCIHVSDDSITHLQQPLCHNHHRH